MSIRDRITQFQEYLTRQIKFSAGNRLLGRVSGAGKGQELTIGTGLEIVGTTLNATGSQPGHTHAFASLTSKPTTIAGYGITDVGPQLIRTSAQGTPRFTEGRATIGGGALAESDASTNLVWTGNPVAYLFPNSTLVVWSTDGKTSPAATGEWISVSHVINNLGVRTQWLMRMYVDGLLDTTITSTGAVTADVTATTWDDGVSDVVVEGNHALVAPAFPGQECAVGDSDDGNGKRILFKSLDGTDWSILGPPDVRQSGEASPDLIVADTWDGPTPTHTLMSIHHYLTA